MKQITEDYCSSEVSKLLKEKGFNVPCRFNYRSKYPNVPKPFYHKSLKDFNGEEYKGLRSEWFSAPTQSLALKWLREVHKLFVKVNYTTQPITKDKNYYGTVINMEDVRETVLVFEDALTYEGCINSLLKYALEKLI